MRVTVVGAGKMGLPLACVFASNGAKVFAADTNPAVVKAVNAGQAPFEEPGLAQLLSENTSVGRLEATTDVSSAVAESDVVVVIVPALLTPEKDADLRVLLEASRSVAKGLRRGTMVSYETTVPIGTTRNHLGPALGAGGLTPGRDFDLVFSPERVKSQHVLRNLNLNLKVVGGVNADAADRGSSFYSTYLGAPVANVGSLEAAEFVKLAGMIYRDVNIALANQLAEYAEDADIEMSGLIDAINSDGEASVLLPGIGVGGHCTPVYPYFYLRDAERRGVDAGLAAKSRSVNDAQAKRVLDRVEKLGFELQNTRVLLLGLAFRPEVKEDAFSTTYLLHDELTARGATAVVDDPMFSADEIEGRGLVPGSVSASDLPSVVVLVTAHASYGELNFEDLAARGVQILVDGRNAWRKEEVEAAGIQYVGMGRPQSGTSSAQRVVTQGAIV